MSEVELPEWEGRDYIMGSGHISTLEGIVRKKRPKINFGFQPPKPVVKRPKTPS